MGGSRQTPAVGKLQHLLEVLAPAHGTCCVFPNSGQSQASTLTHVTGMLNVRDTKNPLLGKETILKRCTFWGVLGSGAWNSQTQYQVVNMISLLILLTRRPNSPCGPLSIPGWPRGQGAAWPAPRPTALPRPWQVAGTETGPRSCSSPWLLIPVAPSPRQRWPRNHRGKQPWPSPGVEFFPRSSCITLILCSLLLAATTAGGALASDIV